MDTTESEDPTPTDSTQDDGSQTSKESTDRKRKDGKYNLRKRTIVARLETEHRLSTPKMPKPKCRPPSLSKYRRKCANSRERQRMQEINVAFNKLQTVLPANCLAEPEESDVCSSLTKITTLRLAVNYIAALRHVLGDDDAVTVVTDDSCVKPPELCPDLEHGEALADVAEVDHDTRTGGNDADRLGLGDQTDRHYLPTDNPTDKCGNSSDQIDICKEVSRVPEVDANNNSVVDDDDDDSINNSPDFLKCRDYIEYLQRGLLEYTSGHLPPVEAERFNACDVGVCGNNNNGPELPNGCGLPLLIAGNLRPPPAYPYP